MDEKHLEMAAEIEAGNRAEAIDAAHRAIEAEGRADCEDCDEAIPAERRLAAPFATRCLGCQEAQELAQQHFFNRFFSA